MNIRSRLEKLEKTNKHQDAPLVMIKFDDVWTSEQKFQIEEARAEERDIYLVTFTCT
ncbi:MAG TPA: hypothetical protein VK141_07450 [Nitrosomonas sp.]|nr:hypothetical protein [Nitrosomonas sp.]